MKRLLCAALIVFSGCALSLPEIRTVSKTPTLPAGYVNAVYTVTCPGTVNPLDVIPVHYYGPDFSDSDPVLRTTERRTCAMGLDGDGGEVDSDDE